MFAPLFKFITGAALAIVAIVGYLFGGETKHHDQHHCGYTTQCPAKH